MSKSAVILSRDPLTLEQIKSIKKKFAVVDAKNKIDKSIAGGFKVQIEDTVYDYTISSALYGHKAGAKKTVGRVESIGDGVAKISGLSDVQSGELLNFASGARGLALNLETNQVGAIVVSGTDDVVPGEVVETSGQILSVGVSEALIGRVVNPLGEALDGKGTIDPDTFYPMEKIAPGVVDRSAVNRPLQTGIKAVDTMIPIGRGQRELIIGDRQTGKTSVGLTTIINQKGRDVVCIYVAIGQKRSSIAQIIATLNQYGAMEHTIVVLASASDSAAMQYLAPYAGCAIGEYFLDKGRDVLVIYDDLTKHAWAYRQISLLLGRPSGREAYPGDVFYAHSRLLERACQLNEKLGGGSLTALPIIETQGGDVSAYIPTNVISITDGQIYLLSDLFNQGQRPAIDVGNSVSRVGSSAQIKAMKQVAGRLRLDLAQYRELEAFAQFASELDEKTQAQLNRGSKLYELLKQPWEIAMDVAEQIIVIWAGVNGYFDSVPNDEIIDTQNQILDHVRLTDSKLLAEISKKGALDEALETRIKENVSYIVSQERQTNGG